ncbi:hypothetical protein [Streptomyces lunaelactis]|nr:hypothetical protein [Streptomyces lunaelactis]
MGLAVDVQGGGGRVGAGICPRPPLIGESALNPSSTGLPSTS